MGSAVPAVRFGHWKLICWLVTANSGAAAPFTMICTPPSCVGQGVCVGAGGLAEVKLYPNSVASDPGLQDWSNELLAELYRPRITAWFEVTLTTVVWKLLKPAVSVAETVTGKAPSCVALRVHLRGTIQCRRISGVYRDGRLNRAVSGGGADQYALVLRHNASDHLEGDAGLSGGRVHRRRQR